MNIKIIKLSDKQRDDKNILSWPIWTCGVSEFDWEYDEQESCFLLEGEVEVKTDNKVVGRLRISKGLLVWIPRHHRKGYGFNWEYFDKIAKENGEYGHK